MDVGICMLDFVWRGLCMEGFDMEGLFKVFVCTEGLCMLIVQPNLSKDLCYCICVSTNALSKDDKIRGVSRTWID